MKIKQDKKIIQIPIPNELHNKYKIKAEKMGLTLSNFGRIALDEFYKKT